MALYVVWLILLTLITVICTYIVVPCFVRVINRSNTDPVYKPSQIIRGVSIPTLIAVALLLSLFGNIQLAIMTLSIVIFVLSEFGFDSGRAHSSLGERIPSSGTLILLVSMLLAAISTAYSFARFVSWYFVPLPIILWFLVGQITM